MKHQLTITNHQNHQPSLSKVMGMQMISSPRGFDEAAKTGKEDVSCCETAMGFGTQKERKHNKEEGDRKRVKAQLCKHEMMHTKQIVNFLAGNGWSKQITIPKHSLTSTVGAEGSSHQPSRRETTNLSSIIDCLHPMLLLPPNCCWLYHCWCTLLSLIPLLMLMPHTLPALHCSFPHFPLENLPLSS